MRELTSHVPRLQRLAVFEAVARLGSFTAAAAELGISQPAVSKHIAQLEDQLRDGELSFDYRMREGVVRKSNALALMRSVGLEL